MKEFERVAQIAEDFAVVRAEIFASHDAAKDLLCAVGARIKADKETTAARIAQLDAQCADLARSETVRRVAQMELDKLRKKTFEPAADEVAAFNEQITAMRAATRDAVKLQGHMREALTVAETALKTGRADVLGDQNIDLVTRWADGLQADFEKL